MNKIAQLIKKIESKTISRCGMVSDTEFQVYTEGYKHMDHYTACAEVLKTKMFKYDFRCYDHFDTLSGKTYTHFKLK